MKDDVRELVNDLRRHVLDEDRVVHKWPRDAARLILQRFTKAQQEEASAI